MMDIKIKGLAHVGIPTSDLEASRKFYESLGFRTLVYAPELEGNNFLFMECNGEIIGLPQSLDADARALRARRAPAISTISHCMWTTSRPHARS